MTVERDDLDTAGIKQRKVCDVRQMVRVDEYLEIRPELKTVLMRKRAVMESLPVIRLVKAASMVSFFSGSEMFTNREPASRATSSVGPLLCALNFMARRAGSALRP